MRFMWERLWFQLPRRRWLLLSGLAVPAAAVAYAGWLPVVQSVGVWAWMLSAIPALMCAGLIAGCFLYPQWRDNRTESRAQAQLLKQAYSLAWRVYRRHGRAVVNLWQHAPHDHDQHLVMTVVRPQRGQLIVARFLASGVEQMLAGTPHVAPGHAVWLWRMPGGIFVERWSAWATRIGPGADGCQRVLHFSVPGKTRPREMHRDYELAVDESRFDAEEQIQLLIRQFQLVLEL